MVKPCWLYHLSVTKCSYDILILPLVFMFTSETSNRDKNLMEIYISPDVHNNATGNVLCKVFPSYT